MTYVAYGTSILVNLVPWYRTSTVGKIYRISAPRADIRGSDCAQQAIKASLVLELVVVAAEVGEDLRKATASFCAIWWACGALVRPP